MLSHSINKLARDTFWSIVEECLQEFHGFTLANARNAADQLRKEIELPPTGLTNDLIYHAEPFDLANDLAPTTKQLDHQYRPQYDRILEQYGW